MALLVVSVVMVCLVLVLSLSWANRHGRRPSGAYNPSVIMTPQRGVIAADLDSGREEIVLAQHLLCSSVTPAR